jgi:protein-tyrosine phosphatase
MKRQPWARAWWVDEHLIGGAYPGALTPADAEKKVNAIVAAGVTLFLDLTEEIDRLEPYEHLIHAVDRDPRVRRVALPVRDLTPPSPEQVREALALIDEEAEAGGVTYVHCWGGIGRTGSIIGCYLARTMGGEAALERLRELRAGSGDSHRQAPETEAQRALVRGWS